MSTSIGLEITRDNTLRLQSNSSTIGLQKLTLDYDGNLRIYSWEADKMSWKPVQAMLESKCSLGSPCGPFGICSGPSGSSSKVNCSCPPGYQSRILEDLLQGCKPLINFNASCGDNASSYDTSMEKMDRSDFYYYDLSREYNVGLSGCKQLCLDDCACIAASLTNTGVCFLKGNSLYGYLLNGYETPSNTLFIKVVKETVTQSDGRWVVGLGVSIPIALLLLIVLGFAVWWRRRGSIPLWPRRKRHQHTVDGPLRYFEYEELLVATTNFSEKLGEGGFRVVYKGFVDLDLINNEPRLRSDQKVPVAVKMLRDRIGEDETDVRMEVKTLGSIHHVNLVRLLGYSFRRKPSGQQGFLVYEYMENRSLSDFLSWGRRFLPWSRRYSIALDVARGLAYLHHECNPPILHCDIKPQNVLLDGRFTAKVADFGMAKRFHFDSHITMSCIHGTRGYLAPEWLTSQELTVKVDVFSYGILLLELVRGFKGGDDTTMVLLDWAMGCITRGAVVDHLSEHANLDEGHEITGQSDDSAQRLQLLKVGVWCVQQKPVMRPSMSLVVQQICGMHTIEDPPNPNVVFGHQIPISSSNHSSSATSRATHPSSVVSAR
ncbi:hypothetical protein KP509_37G023200 [Ceratopteris richardii]|uniref:non-specific serine/threonine protein kinase n=1 Tax=Ceratopteris richardii TaxID=49495 RepID=A0A8T2Q661_CERRI|nr:hypothetical protein KP509_37G023200 [Ceratopteris richardii]